MNLAPWQRPDAAHLTKICAAPPTIRKHGGRHTGAQSTTRGRCGTIPFVATAQPTPPPDGAPGQRFRTGVGPDQRRYGAADQPRTADDAGRRLPRPRPKDRTCLNNDIGSTQHPPRLPGPMSWAGIFAPVRPARGGSGPFSVPAANRSGLVRLPQQAPRKRRCWKSARKPSAINAMTPRPAPIVQTCGPHQAQLLPQLNTIATGV